jgi:hypothetical protein
MQSVLTVNTVAASYDLTTVATVKAELGILTTSEDASLAVWITQASAACASYCNRVLSLETVTETFRNRFTYPFHQNNFRNIASVLLARTPIVSAISVVQDTVVLTQDVDYQLDANQGIIYRLNPTDDSLVQWYFKKLVINYTGGYGTITSIPRNIERACITQVQVIRASASRDPNIKSENIPGVFSTTYWSPSVTDNGALGPEVTALLDPYRNISV